jgi:hypothetical protein
VIQGALRELRNLLVARLDLLGQVGQGGVRLGAAALLLLFAHLVVSFAAPRCLSAGPCGPVPPVARHPSKRERQRAGITAAGLFLGRMHLGVRLAHKAASPL